MLSKPADGVIFIDLKIEESFNTLPDNDIIKKAIYRNIESIKENIFCGKNISKNKIPKIYITKYGVDNLWWLPLPNGWRLVYTVLTPSNVQIIGAIVEYFNHHDYEERFGY